MATAGNPNYNSTPTIGGRVGWSMLTPDGWVTSNDQTQNNLVSSPTPTNMPNQTTPTNGNTNNNMYNQVVDTLGQAKTGMTNAMNYQPMAFNQENLNQYLNPYTSEVIDRSLSNLEDARQGKRKSSVSNEGSMIQSDQNELVTRFTETQNARKPSFPSSKDA